MATTENVKIVVSAENKTKSTFDGVGGSFDSLKEKVGGLAKSAGVVAVAAFAAAGAAAVSFASSSLKAYMDAEKEMVVANQALKNSLDGLSKGALGNLQKELGVGSNLLDGLKGKMDEVGKSAVMLAFDDEEASVAFAKLFQITKDVTKAQEEVKLAMDLAAFSGRGLDEATRALTLVHAGGTRILKEFGIAVEEGTTVEEALALAHAKVKGSAEAMAGTLSGQLTIMSTSWANIKETVGEVLATFANPIMQNINNFLNSEELQAKISVVTDAMKTLMAAVNEAGGWFNFFREIITQVLSYIDENTMIISILRDAWSEVSAMFMNELVPQLQSLWVELKPLMPFIIELAKLIASTLILALIGLIQVIKVQLIITIQLLTAVLKAVNITIESFRVVWESVKNTIMTVINYIDQLIEKIRNLNAIKAVTNFASNLFGGGKAEGGFVSPSRMYMVGENGPEMFMPASSGSIIPTNKLLGAGGSNITIQISGNTFLDDDAAEFFGNKIVSILKKEMRV